MALGFEEADQLKNPVRPRAFVKQFGIEYPFLLVGEPEDAPAKKDGEKKCPNCPDAPAPKA